MKKDGHAPDEEGVDNSSACKHIARWLQAKGAPCVELHGARHLSKATGLIDVESVTQRAAAE